jgi:hypothetical protein
VTHRNKVEVQLAREALGQMDVLNRKVTADWDKFLYPPGLGDGPASDDDIHLRQRTLINLYSGPDGTLVGYIQARLDALGLPDRIENCYVPDIFTRIQNRFSLALFPQLGTLRCKLEIIAAAGDLATAPPANPTEDGAKASDPTQATPETDNSLIYQAAGAELYSIPKSVLNKNAKKKPGEPGYLWSGRGAVGKSKRLRVWHRKGDLAKIGRSRKALGRASAPAVTTGEKPKPEVSQQVHSEENLAKRQAAFLARISPNDTERED